MEFLIINGPNLNMLGNRNKENYGENSLKDLESSVLKYANKNKLKVKFFQSNIEGDIIEKIHSVFYDGIDGLVINPGAYGHYSIAIRDALEILNIPIIEVHISNIYKREEFRQKSVIAPICLGQITGLGLYGYILALEKLKNIIDSRGN